MQTNIETWNKSDLKEMKGGVEERVELGQTAGRPSFPGPGDETVGYSLESRVPASWLPSSPCFYHISGLVLGPSSFGGGW